MNYWSEGTYHGEGPPQASASEIAERYRRMEQDIAEKAERWGVSKQQVFRGWRPWNRHP